MLKFVERKKDRISPVTYKGYTNLVKGRIRHFFDPLGVTITSLTPQLIEEFLDNIADGGCNSSTQQRYYQLIGACLKSAMKKDHIDRNPIDKVDRPKRAKFTASYYSREEALQLLECASLMVAQGIPMKQIQIFLGHSTFSTTADIYSHLSTAAMDEPANCMAGLLTCPAKNEASGLCRT